MFLFTAAAVCLLASMASAQNQNYGNYRNQGQQQQDAAYTDPSNMSYEDLLANQQFQQWKEGQLTYSQYQSIAQADAERQQAFEQYEAMVADELYQLEIEQYKQFMNATVVGSNDLYPCMDPNGMMYYVPIGNNMMGGNQWNGQQQANGQWSGQQQANGQDADGQQGQQEGQDAQGDAAEGENAAEGEEYGGDEYAEQDQQQGFNPCFNPNGMVYYPTQFVNGRQQQAWMGGGASYIAMASAAALGVAATVLFSHYRATKGNGGILNDSLLETAKGALPNTGSFSLGLPSMKKTASMAQQSVTEACGSIDSVAV